MKTMHAAATVLSLSLACAEPALCAPPQSSTYKVLYAFQGGADGKLPVGGLVNVSGTLYGITLQGGGSQNCGDLGCGVVFSLDPSNGSEKILHAFNGTDGGSPGGSLLGVKGKLYGTTTAGGSAGANGVGTVFALNTKKGTETFLYSFQGNPDGQDPQAGLVNVGGILYGTTASGGSAGNGAIFSVDSGTGVEHVVHSFKGNDGSDIAAGLINVNGTLYGTASQGGKASGGTVFSFDPATGTFDVLNSFTGGADGGSPEASLVAAGGLLYGTTAGGGSLAPCNGGCGVVFSVDPSTGAEKTVYTFPGDKHGGLPFGNLIAVKGHLYGTTLLGGDPTCGCGTVFSVDVATGKETAVHTFLSGTDGAFPVSGLIDVAGTLYGTTTEGGATPACERCGTVYAYTP